MEQLDALLAQKALLSQKRDHPVAEQPLRGAGIEEGNRIPAPLAVPAAARAQGVNMGMPRGALRIPVA
jgi:hypothetical protein